MHAWCIMGYRPPQSVLSIGTTAMVDNRYIYIYRSVKYLRVFLCFSFSFFFANRFINTKYINYINISFFRSWMCPMGFPLQMQRREGGLLIQWEMKKNCLDGPYPWQSFPQSLSLSWSSWRPKLQGQNSMNLLTTTIYSISTRWIFTLQASK